MSSDEKKMRDALVGIARHSSKDLSVHGVGAKGVGWKDKASHQLRHDKLVKVIDLRASSEGISVNDWGCGYGAMFHYLDEMPSLRLTQYYGYDISEEMLAAAQQFVADPRAEFIQSSQVTNEADYSFVCGTFYLKLEASDELWTKYMQEVLMNLASMSLKGFAFNALSTYVDWKEEHLYYADPFMFFDFCKRNISRYVSLLHDYPLYEWTMIVRKEI